MEKLAGPRDTAKRFLRLFTNGHFTPPDQPASSDPMPPRPVQSSARASLVSQFNSRRWTWPTGLMSPWRRHLTVGSLGPWPAPVENHRSPIKTSAKTAIESVVRSVLEEKPLASGDGISVSISLTEPVLFLQGFKQTHTSERRTTMLRGSLNLRFTKPTKIKAINLNFHGKTVTKWPNGNNFVLPSSYVHMR